MDKQLLHELESLVWSSLEDVQDLYNETISPGKQRVISDRYWKGRGRLKELFAELNKNNDDEIRRYEEHCASSRHQHMACLSCPPDPHK